jgi:endo-1,4-beta-xylanase
MKHALPRVGRVVVGLLVSATLAFAAEGSDMKPSEDDKQAIVKHRMGRIIIRTKPGVAVKVTQKRHEFGFGTALSRKMWREGVDPVVAEQYLGIVKANFNCAVHENALKWYSVERQRPGNPDYRNAEQMLAWCEGNEIPMRGHCIFWGVDKCVQPWLRDLDDRALRQTVERRGREVPTRFRGRIGDYDVNNEMIHGSYYARRLGDDIRVKMFQWARKSDPGAVLYVNDYNILSGRDVEKYARHIQGLIDGGAPVGGIGVQGHFGKPVPMATVRKALDRLARFKLPIKVTEYDLNTGSEQEKAKFLEDFYRTCFAHPSVEAILMWGFWEGAHWRPRAALWKKDFTPTAMAKTYRKLVFDRWWTRAQRQADDKGRCEIQAFYGRHEITVGEATREIALNKASGDVEIDAVAADPAKWAVSNATKSEKKSTP